MLTTQLWLAASVLSSTALAAGPVAPTLNSPSSGRVPHADGELVFLQGGTTASLNRISYRYDGGAFTLGDAATTAYLPSARSLLLTSNRGMLVSGVGTEVFCVDPESGAFQTAVTSGMSAANLMLDPEGGRGFGTGQEGTLTEFQLSPFALGATHTLTGDDVVLNQMVQVGSEVFYSAQDERGEGVFGRLDLSTFETTRLISGIPAGHGLVHDAHTGHLLLFGQSAIAQVDPTDPTRILASASFASHAAFDGGQGSFIAGAVNGEGLAVGATQSGHVLFLDYKSSGRISQPTTTQVQFVAPNLGSLAFTSTSTNLCETRAVADGYGQGWPGTFGVPAFSAPVPPQAGGLYQIFIGNSSGGVTKGCLLLSKSRALMPTNWGGVMNIEVNDETHTIALPSIPPGGLNFTVTLPALAPETCGAECYLQAVELDPRASHGISFTRGLEIRLGVQ